MSKTNNDVYEKLGELVSETKGINRRLDVLNGQVSRNTRFRLKHLGAYKFISLLGVCVAGLVGIWKSFF
jgi:hypothetical protein